MDSISASPDVTLELGVTNQVTEDQDVAVDNLAGIVMLVDLGALPAASDVSGYELLPDGDELLCFDTTVELPGGVVAAPGDVVRYEDSVYTTEFDADANGVPAGAYCDAVTIDESGNLVLSFDTTVSLPGPGGTAVVADDEDLVAVVGPMLFTSFFDGSAAGVHERADVDGSQQLANGNIALSFDVSGTVDGVAFDDEDVLEYVPSTMFWFLSIDGSAQDARWAAADIDGLALSQPACIGDVDGDGITGAPDFSILATHFGQAVPPGTNGDLNGDGTVGAPDFSILAGDFGCTP